MSYFTLLQIRNLNSRIEFLFVLIFLYIKSENKFDNFNSDNIILLVPTFWYSMSIWYYKHTAFSWGCYGKLLHEGKNITLWKKNITRDEVEGDILFPKYDIFSRVWSSTITPSTKGSMFFIILNASSKEDFEFLLESFNQ